MQTSEPPKGATTCPNCKNPMASRQVEVFYRPDPVDIDVCASCNLLWFDRSECISMSARSVLDLFEFLRRTRKPQSQPSAHMACPRCESALALTQDTRGVEQFTYWRCRHGELMTFTQFLLRKQFLRTAAAEEIAKFRTSARLITCTQCGASVNMVNGTVCSHCNSPITLLDPDGIAKAIHDMNQRASKDSVENKVSETKVRAAIAKAQEDALASGPSAEYRDMFLGDLIPNGLSKEENDRIAFVRRRAAEIAARERREALERRQALENRDMVDNHSSDVVGVGLCVLADLIAAGIG